MKTTKAFTLILLGLLFLSSAGGCLVAHSSNQSYSGNYIPQDTFDRIETGKTTAAWVQATLGEPSTKDKVDGSTEVWKYSYTAKESSGAIFLIFGGSDKKEQQRVAYVEMTNGIVSKKWRA